MWVLEYYGLFYMFESRCSLYGSKVRAFARFTSRKYSAMKFRSRVYACSLASELYRKSSIYCNIRRWEDVEDNEEIAHSTGTHTFDFPF